MNIKNREQFLMVLAIIAVALLLGNWILIEPLTKLWKAREATITQLRGQVSAGRMMVRRESSIRDHWSQIQTNSLPGTASSAELQMSQAFDKWSQASGVNIDSITPQWQDDQSDYSTLDCRVDATGDLQTLTRFLYQIESDPLAVQIQSIELLAKDDQGQQLTLSVDLSGLAIVSNAK
jgi:Tfp pilus assembly protein PilO